MRRCKTLIIKGFARVPYNGDSLVEVVFRGRFVGTQAGLITPVRFADFEFDPRSGQLRQNNVLIRLQQQPAKILALLVTRPGEIVTRRELVEEVWGGETFVDFEQGLNYAIRQIRSALHEDADQPRFIETIPKRGYRFIAPVTAESPAVAVPLLASDTGHFKWKRIAVAMSVVLVALFSTFFLLRRKPPSHKNTILVTDFVNRTGDPVFDGVLRQGLSVQLQQSPFLRLVSDEQFHETLAMMGKGNSFALSSESEREACQRSNASVALDGSLALIGNRYELIVRAIECAKGNLLASAEARADDKNHVLDALTKLASEIRSKLGESLGSVQRYNVPLASATTASLEALRCYTQAMQAQSNQFDYAESLAWLHKALDLDPNFAMAYWAVGDVYAILGETSSAEKYTRKAFELRHNVSERERALIEANYFYYVLGDVEQARRSAELLSKMYPYSEDAHTSLAAFAESVGQYDVGLVEYQQSLQLAPRNSFLYRDVAYTYLVLDRLDDASAVMRKAHENGLDANLAPVLYSIAFYKNDRDEMARQVANAASKAELKDLLWAMDADTAAYGGKVKSARLLSERAAETAERSGRNETSMMYRAASAVREGLFGNPREAQQQAKLAAQDPVGRDVAYGVALATLYSGDANRGERLAEELAKRFPEDTVVKCNYLPALRAKLALLHSNPDKAIEILSTTETCEGGVPVYSYYNWPNLYPAYVRGEAYLAAHRGPEAAVEFQKIISHRGLVLNEPIGALSALQLGRAYVISCDTDKARAAYKSFLDLWKDADPNFPLLRQAKLEYSQLNSCANH